MKRIKDEAGLVHFWHGTSLALCGCLRTDLLGNPAPTKPTTDPVTCPTCAKLWHQIKNSKWNEVDDAVADEACYAAVEDDLRRVSQNPDGGNCHNYNGGYAAVGGSKTN